MQFSDRVQIENGLFHLYRLYGSTTCETPFTSVKREIYSLNEMQFSDRVGLKTAYSICTDRTDRQPVNPTSLQ